MLIKYYYLKKVIMNFIRYNDVKKMMIVPLQLKINNSYNKINAFKKNKKVMLIYDNDK